MEIARAMELLERVFFLDRKTGCVFKGGFFLFASFFLSVFLLERIGYLNSDSLFFVIFVRLVD